jgi:hypothetical protein
MRLERVGQLKNLTTPSRTEPALSGLQHSVSTNCEDRTASRVKERETKVEKTLKMEALFISEASGNFYKVLHPSIKQH